MAIFQQFSEARKKSLTFKWVLNPFKLVNFVNKHKINIKIAWKIANVNISRYITSEPKKIARFRKLPM